MWGASFNYRILLNLASDTNMFELSNSIWLSNRFANLLATCSVIEPNLGICHISGEYNTRENISYFPLLGPGFGELLWCDPVSKAVYTEKYDFWCDYHRAFAALFCEQAHIIANVQGSMFTGPPQPCQHELRHTLVCSSQYMQVL